MLDWKKELYLVLWTELETADLKVRLKDCVMAPLMEVEKVDLFSS